MKKLMTAAFALSALFAASGKAHAEVNYPWCIMGDTRGFECVFSSREQCMQDGRNRGFGSQCVQNPAYKPGKPTVSQTSRPSRAVSAARAYYPASAYGALLTSPDLRPGSGYRKNFDLYWRDCAIELRISDPNFPSPLSYARPDMKDCVDRKVKLATKTSGR